MSDWTSWLPARRVSLLLGAALMIVSCGPPQAGDAIPCGDEQRVALDCNTEIAYQGVKTGGGVQILSLGGGHATYEEDAIREVNAELEQYITVQSRLCRDYNGCAISRDQYQAEAAKTRDRFETANQLAAKLGGATGLQRQDLIGSLYHSVVPEDRHPEQVTLQIKIDALIPDAAGGGAKVLRPSAPLPTNARLKFAFTPSKATYLYVYQVDAKGQVNVLFPNEKIANVPNPVAAGTQTLIPPGEQRIRVTEDDVGTVENVFILASVNPVPQVDAVLKGASAAAVQVTSDPLLGSLTKIDANTIGACRGLEVENPCGGTRGLEIESGAASMVTRTSPGDDVIVKVFPFTHVTEAEYPAKAQAFEASAEGSRGVIIED